MARIGDLLAAGRTFSFEFSPPKSAAGSMSLGRMLVTLQRILATQRQVISPTPLNWSNICAPLAMSESVWLHIRKVTHGLETWQQIVDI